LISEQTKDNSCPNVNNLYNQNIHQEIQKSDISKILPTPISQNLQDNENQQFIQKYSITSQLGIINSDIKIIENEINKFDDGWTLLLETSASNVLKLSLGMIKTLTDKNYFGIIISANRPHDNLFSLYNSNNIDIEKLFILDLVSQNQNIDLEDTKNVYYIESNSSLTNISIALNEIFLNIPGKKFFFIDSITTMLIHNKPDIFSRFIHCILTKTRFNKINSLFISLDDETDRKVRTEISQLCDKILKI
jgi:hypothetical protein